MSDETQPENASDSMALRARIAGDRGRMWEALRVLLERERAVDSQTFPDWTSQVVESIAWIGEEGPLFEEAFELTQSFQKQAARSAADQSDPDAKNAAFQSFYTEQWEWTFGRDSAGQGRRDDVDRFASSMADLCRRESAACEAKDEIGADVIRAEELQKIEGGAQRLVDTVVVPLISAGSTLIGKLVAEFLLAIITLESGRDYQGVVYDQK